MQYKVSSRQLALLLAAIIVCVAIGFYGARRWSAQASGKAITISDLETYKAYEALDRDQALMLSESQKLQVRYDEDGKRKLELRKRLGVPENFVEKREDDKNPSSPVVGFVEPPEKK